MLNFSKRNMIIISVILSLVILISLNFILKIFKENQIKENNLNLETSQLKSNKNEKENNYNYTNCCSFINNVRNIYFY